MTQVEPNRDGFPDFCKGILIGLVVLGHTIQYIVYDRQADALRDPLFSAIYMFHMPLFMALSGYFATNEKLRSTQLISLVLQRYRQLLRPMITWVILIVMIRIPLELAQHNFEILFWLKQSIKAIFLSYWFLWAVFLSYLTIRILIILPLPLKTSAPLFALILALLPIDRVPLIGETLSMFSFMFPFFYAGSFYGSRFSRTALDNLNDQSVLNKDSSHAARLTSLTKYLLSTCLACLTIWLFLNWQPENYVYINKMDLVHKAKPVLRMLAGGTIASLLVIRIAHFIYERVNTTWISSQLVSLGKVTLQMYLAQGFLFTLLGAAGINLAGHLPYLASIITASLMTIALLAIVKVVLGYSKVLQPTIIKHIWGMEPSGHRS